MESLLGVTLNVYDPTCTGNASLCTPVETITIGTLDPGDDDTPWSHTYDVAIGDNTSTSQCAGSAVFQRRVITFGTGALTNTPYISSTNVSGDPLAVPVNCEPCIDCSD